MHVEHLGWSRSGALRILDQTLLPAEERWLEIATLPALVEAIRSLRVRGAPAIGIAAAMGLVAVLRERTKSGVPEEAYEDGVREGFLAIVDAVVTDGLATLEKAEVRFYRTGQR